MHLVVTDQRVMETEEKAIKTRIGGNIRMNIPIMTEVMEMIEIMAMRTKRIITMRKVKKMVVETGPMKTIEMDDMTINPTSLQNRVRRTLIKPLESGAMTLIFIMAVKLKAPIA